MKKVMILAISLIIFAQTNGFCAGGWAIVFGSSPVSQDFNISGFWNRDILTNSTQYVCVTLKEPANINGVSTKIEVVFPFDDNSAKSKAMYAAVLAAWASGSTVQVNLTTGTPLLGSRYYEIKEFQVGNLGS